MSGRRVDSRFGRGALRQQGRVRAARARPTRGRHRRVHGAQRHGTPLRTSNADMYGLGHNYIRRDC